MTPTLLLGLLIFMFLSVPIVVALGLSSILAMQVKGMPLIAVGQTVFEAVDSFHLMAIPCFILAGHLMHRGGISMRLIALANVLLGWIRGGLGAVSVLSSMFFATMSGSSAATTAAIGSILVPAMKKEGYPKNFAASVSASSGELGVILPPSIPLIVYALAANVSVGSLFLAGIVPGLLIGVSLILTVHIVSRLRGYGVVHQFTFREWAVRLWTTFADATFALVMPLLILGGIYGGWFTPTEASVIAVIYALIVAVFIYREVRPRELLDIFGKAAVSSAVVLMLVGFASTFAFILTIEQIPHWFGSMLAGIANNNAILFLLFVNLLLFVVGMFMETLAAIIILAPILAPAALMFGIDPIHFGIVMVVNLAIGMVTPPLGINLFVVCEVAKLRIEQLMRPLLIFLAVLVVNVLVISYIPGLSLMFE